MKIDWGKFTVLFLIGTILNTTIGYLLCYLISGLSFGPYMAGATFGGILTSLYLSRIKP